MERRDFLSGAAGAAATAVGAVAPQAAHAAIPPGLDLGNFVARLDRTLDALTTATLCDLTPPDGESAKWSRYDLLCRKALRSLHLVSTFHDLPREARHDPRLQERMWSGLPEMDEAVFGMAEALDEIGDNGLRELRDVFLNDADVRAQTMERLSSGIEAAEITEERLDRSRSLLRQIQSELGRRNPSGMVADAVRQVRSLEGVREGGPDVWAAALSVESGFVTPVAEETGERWTRGMRAGGWLMGIGLVGGGAVAGVGLLTSNCELVCVGVGLGALLLVVGLGFLLVAAIRRALRERTRELDPALR